ncbi:MAG: hypothetical protein V7K64_01600 [Nostoc sp.]|nr:hypothetical protein [Nostoc sp. JL34]MBN3882258.1 hypothetical protein [Nostoc sp. JL34]
MTTGNRWSICDKYTIVIGTDNSGVVLSRLHGDSRKFELHLQFIAIAS